MIELIRRNTPSIASCFILETIEKENGKSVYTVSERKGRIVLGGDCKISQAMAYYRYLKEYCGVSLSHCGNTKIPDITEAPAPKESIKKVIEQDKRFYMNYSTFGYSCAWWGWDEWEREIDFMAMNGINMPLCLVGTEAVWFYALRELKYSENGALRYLSGPAFWPWQLTGNLTEYFPLADKQYIDERLKLGRQIINRVTELGMTPVLPGFNGTVPRSISRLFKQIRLHIVKSWMNFPVTYIVDPTDVLFKKLGRAYLEKQKELLGAFHYYACDPLRESKPTSKAKNYLWNYGRSIDNLLKDFDSESVWVIQSWTFYEQMINAVPKGRLLVLDVTGEKYKATGGFGGHNFILGGIYNYGDKNTLHGSIDALAKNSYISASEEYPNLCGTGLFPEGINQNPLFFELAFQMLTESGEVDLNDWLADYARRRYGSDEKCLVEAMEALHESCYSENCTGRETGSMICARPSTNLRHASIGDTLTLKYDNKKLLQAAELLLSAENASTDGYAYDVCDITRQVLSNLVNSLYFEVSKAYESKNSDLFERNSNLFLKILEELDSLLQTRPELTLCESLKKAGSRAFTDKEKQNFELNLLCQITLWGPANKPLNYDYAWREWGGLVGTYYAARWHSYFEQLAVFFKKKKFSTETKKQPYERNLYNGSKIYKNYEKFEKNWLSTVAPEEPSGEDTVEVARELIEKYKRYISGTPEMQL